MTDKYQDLREALPDLIAEASRAGGINRRAQMIIDLLAERDSLWEALSGTAPTSRDDATGWVSVDDALPDMDVPVWCMMDHGAVIGGRSDAGDEGWLWGRCYSSPWINKNGEWAADIECDDEYQVTAWHPLPEPPKVAGEDEK